MTTKEEPIAAFTHARDNEPHLGLLRCHLCGWSKRVENEGDEPLTHRIEDEYLKHAATDHPTNITMSPINRNGETVLEIFRGAG